MYSTRNKGKSVVAERFIRTLKNKIYKYLTSVSKNFYTDKLDDLVNKYNNTYHSTIKRKPINLKSSTYADSSKGISDKDPKFKIGNNVTISKYENASAKGYTPDWSEKDFVIKKVKNTVPWTYVSNDLNGEEIIGCFMKNNYKKQIKNNLELKKYSKEKIINYILNGKVLIIHLILE